MALLLYFAFVAVAIGGVALLLNRLGKGREAEFSIEEARAHFLKAHPDETPEEERVFKGGVLLGLGAHRVAIIRPMGMFPLVRILARSEVSAVEALPGSLRIRTKDFADPQIKLGTDNAAVLRAWLEERLG
ncbi:hypothetical protein [Parvularcula marina]|uniref:hypothetical protein n=1 Tax=Parvularcula marina TaxID=2292771 RepID=UPI0035184C29